ncbi:MAG TPA: hypothetical protein VLA67_07255 [Nitrospiraceae bacterium]|nr:hypothetical protein [Nitrospiraceae bacterium]
MVDIGPILVTGAAGQLGAVGRTVTGLLLERDFPFAPWSGAKTTDRLPCEERALRYLEATVIMAAVARELRVEVLVNMSQMTVSQMSIQDMTPSPQQRQTGSASRHSRGLACRSSRSGPRCSSRASSFPSLLPLSANEIALNCRLEEERLLQSPQLMSLTSSLAFSASLNHT